MVKLHKKSFPKKNTVLVMKDPVEKDEVYFVHKLNDLMEIGGHYTYYEKNPCMQNYMISSRKKNGVSPSETVEDRATKDFRSLVRTREEQQQQQKRSSRLMYAVSACLVLIIIIMGVTTLNNFDKMKSVQTALNNISSSASGDAQAVEARETSGNVTAVGGESPGDTDGSQQASDGQALAAEADDNSTNNGEGSSKDGSLAEDDSEETVQIKSGTNGSDGVYVVEEGDTLAIISKKMYGDVGHVESICKMNGLSDGNLIYVGQKLLLP